MQDSSIEKVFDRSATRERWVRSVVNVNRLLWSLTFAIIAFMWFEEIIDLPHLLGFQRTPINWVESISETTVILAMGAFIIWLCNRLLRHIRYLEGFHVICASCKRIRFSEKWISIEQYMREYTSLKLSHSICPDCAKDKYGYTDEEGSSHKEHLP